MTRGQGQVLGLLPQQPTWAAEAGPAPGLHQQPRPWARAAAGHQGRQGLQAPPGKRLRDLDDALRQGGGGAGAPQGLRQGDHDEGGGGRPGGPGPALPGRGHWAGWPCGPATPPGTLPCRQLGHEPESGSGRFHFHWAVAAPRQLQPADTTAATTTDNTPPARGRLGASPLAEIGVKENFRSYPLRPWLWPGDLELRVLRCNRMSTIFPRPQITPHLG